MTGALTFNNSNTNFWYNTTGTYFTNNNFTSYFSLNANVNTNFGLNSQPFIRVYNRMWKNGANTAMDIKTFGGANSVVNSDVLIRIDSGGDPTPGANVGTITFNINGSDKHIITGSGMGIGTTTIGSYALNVNGTSYLNGNASINGTLISSGNVGIGTATANNILQVGNAGRLKIGSGTTDYSLIGTLDTDGATNTRIVVSGNTRSGYAGNIEYYATSNGNHLFYTTNTNIERMRINSNGLVGIGTNDPLTKLDVRGSISAYTLCAVDGVSYTNQFQLIMYPPSSGISGAIQTIQQNYGYNQNLKLQPFGGTITLTGATNCASTLTINNSATSRLVFDNFLNDFKIQM
jgi:hypothetical protein